MSYKQGHDSQGSYVDNIRVKISERYKPPHRINLPMTYSQRLNLNSQIQDNFPKYEFHLEKSVLEKMKELKAARTNYQSERKARLDLAREEVKKKEKERSDREKSLKEVVDAQSIEETVTTLNNSIFNHTVLGSVTSHPYSTDSSILMPTQASSYSNILTPIPLSKQTYSSKPADKSPFNISDFEDDTSSPFDNMELKSINDIEELAQVLNPEDSLQRNNTQTFPLHQSTSQMHPNYNNYSGSQYQYVPNMMQYMGQPANNYPITNGYYYPESNGMYQQPYYYGTKSTLDNSSYVNNLQETKKSNCKSVPDIMNALETELNNTQLNSKADVVTNNKVSEPVRPKSTDIVFPKAKTKAKDDEILSILPKQDHEMCKSICSMGFPLDRVARTCKLVGNDQKKIVDHLLALTDLLDLGFSEKDVSSALLQCNNDRDQALDKLIS